MNAPIRGRLTRGMHPRPTTLAALLAALLLSAVAAREASAVEMAVPPDYVVTLSSGALVVSDVSGNGEPVAITEPVAGSIRFAAAGRVFQVNGGPNLLNDSGSLSLTGVTSITVNAGAGNDGLAVGAFTSALPSLTLNGGAGDDAVTFGGAVTLASGANLNVDLQDDGAPVGVDAVTLAAGANVLASGTGTITIRCSRNVTLGSAARLETVNGDLTVEANRQFVGPSTGNFVGVNVDSALIRASGTGAVTVKGRGGDDPAGSQFGVYAQNGASIIGGAIGTVQVDGVGGPSTGNRNTGARVATRAIISSLGANIVATGQGGGAGAATGNAGVVVTDQGQVTAGGVGAVAVQGTGGTTNGESNSGVAIQLGGTVASGGGNVIVNGQGGGTPSAGGFQNGVAVILSSQITAGGSGAVFVQGTGGQAAGNQCIGVHVDRQSVITSGGGNVSVFGQAGGASSAGALQIGVNVTLSGQITAGGNGIVTVQGTGGGANGNQNSGVQIDQSSIVTSGGGNVTVIGQGGGTPSAGPLQIGVIVFSGQVTAGGNGTVTVQGTGGPSAGQQNAGVTLLQGVITSSGGAVSIAGYGGGSNLASVLNDGVTLGSAPAFINSGGGDVSVTGTPGAGAAATGIRLYSGSGISTATLGGDIMLNADRMVFLAGSAISTQAAGSVTVLPLTNGRPIDLLGPGWTAGTGTLVLLDEDLDAIDAGTINIGDANSGSIFVAGPITHPPSTGATIPSPMAAARMPSKLRGDGPAARPVPLTRSEVASVADEAEVTAVVAPLSPNVALADVDVPAGEAQPSQAELPAMPARSSLPAATQAIASDFVLTSGDDIELATSTDRSFDTGGGTLLLRPGGAGAVIPVAAGTDVVASALTMGPGARLGIAIAGTSVDTQYAQLSVAGPMDLTGVDLALSGSHVPSIGEQFTIVRNGLFATTGEFNGLPEGGYLLNFLGSPLAARITYQGGNAPPSVPNFSFEQPNGGVGNPNGGQATGWTANGGASSGGVGYFAFGFPTSSEGTQYHWLNLPGFGGPNPSVTRSNAGLIGTAQAGTYTLTVAGGRRDNDATTDGSYVVELLAGGTVIGSQTVNNPFATYAPGSWNDITAVAVVAAGSPAVGQDLSIRLSAFDGTGGIRSQGQFDRVRLSFVPLGPNDDVVLTVVSTTSTPAGSTLPTVSGLSAPGPNPFTNAASLTFALAARGDVDLAIYSVDGRRVRALARGAHEPGQYHLTWDGTTENGARVSSGVYFVRLVTPQGTFRRSLVLLD